MVPDYFLSKKARIGGARFGSFRLALSFVAFLAVASLASVVVTLKGYRGRQRLSIGGDIVSSYRDKAWDLGLQLRRLRQDLDNEVRARGYYPHEWTSLTTTYEWWSDIGLGARQSPWGPVYQQLRLFPAIPPVSNQAESSWREIQGVPFRPVTWFVSAQELRGQAYFNSSLLGQQPDKLIMLAADVFFVDGCVRLIAVPECDWMLDWHNMTIAIHGAWREGACVDEPGGKLHCPVERRTLKSDGPMPVMRVRTRTVNEWNVIVDFCSRHLVDEAVVDVEFYNWGVSKRFQLTRVIANRRQEEEVSMVALVRNGLDGIGAWTHYWRALGVGRFYLYMLGGVAAASRNNSDAVQRLIHDPAVTLIDWTMRFDQQGGLAMSSDLDRCTGHFGQILAFNHAYERVRRRHLYMGFFDPDEYGMLDPTLLQAAWASDANPLLMLLGRYGYPPALILANRFGAVRPTPPFGSTLADAANREWYARNVTERARGKTWVRTMNMREDMNIGNHNVFEFAQIASNLRTGTVHMSGHGYETSHLKLGIHAEPEHASFLHALNLREHVSKLDLNVESEVFSMVRAGNEATSVMLTFQRAVELEAAAG